MSVADFVRRKDLWPTRVKLLENASFGGSDSVHAGQEVGLQDYNGSKVTLDTGKFLFEWPAAKTDVLERARALAASLTPDALALTLDALPARPDLWPLRVKLSSAIQFADGTVAPAGRDVALRFYEGSLLSVYDRAVANYYTVEPQQTDMIGQARERLKLGDAERQPFFIRSLGAALEPRDGAAAKRLAGAEYVLVYAARLGCARCAQFRPELDQFYERMQPKAVRFELVLLSNDPDAQSAAKYVADSHFPGGVIAFDRRLEAANLLALPLQLLPGLFVFDRAGNLIERNHPNGGAPSAADVLARFEKRLNESPTPAR